MAIQHTPWLPREPMEIHVTIGWHEACHGCWAMRCHSEARERINASPSTAALRQAADIARTCDKAMNWISVAARCLEEGEGGVSALTGRDLVGLAASALRKALLLAEAALEQALPGTGAAPSLARAARASLPMPGGSLPLKDAVRMVRISAETLQALDESAAVKGALDLHDGLKIANWTCHMASQLFGSLEATRATVGRYAVGCWAATEVCLFAADAIPPFKAFLSPTYREHCQEETDILANQDKVQREAVEQERAYMEQFLADPLGQTEIPQRICGWAVCDPDWKISLPAEVLVASSHRCEITRKPARHPMRPVAEGARRLDLPCYDRVAIEEWAASETSPPPEWPEDLAGPFSLDRVAVDEREQADIDEALQKLAERLPTSTLKNRGKKKAE